MICDSCAYYDYDEESECWVCGAELDEDELYRFIQNENTECRFYDPYDEYKVVKKQN